MKVFWISTSPLHFSLRRIELMVEMDQTRLPRGVGMPSEVSSAAIYDGVRTARKLV